MKKIISALCLAGLLMFTVNESQAQDKRFGLKGGATMYKGSFSFAGFDESTDSGIGFAAGVFAEFPLSDLFSIQPELLFIQKNTKEEDSFFGDTETIKTTFSYIDIPVLLKVNIPLEGSVSPYIAAGPYLGYLLDAQESFGGESEDIKEYLNDLHYGLVFGAGLNFGSLSLEFRYDLGLANVFDEDLITGEFDDFGDFGDFFGDIFGGGDSFESRLSGFSVTLGISF